MAPDVQSWIAFAETDLGVAKHLAATYYPKPLEIICYHCQQAAEKAIKALYLALQIPGGLPRKHDLSFLLNQMRDSVPIPPEIRQYADRLNVYGVIVRYPAEISIDEQRTALAIQFAGAIVCWAKACLEKCEEEE